MYAVLKVIFLSIGLGPLVAIISCAEGVAIPPLLVIECGGGEIHCKGNKYISGLTDNISGGSSQGGMVYKQKYITHSISISAVDKISESLVSIDLYSGVAEQIFALDKNLYEQYDVTSIGGVEINYVDDKNIYFSAYTGGVKKNQGYHIYCYSRKDNIIKRLAVENCSDSHFSIFEERIYYTGIDKNIYEFFNGRARSLNIKGASPSISPNGRLIAYIQFGIVMENIWLHNLFSGERKRIGKFFGPHSVERLLRWSHDSRFIALRGRSDLWRTSILIKSVDSSKTVGKIENLAACNWQFLKAD